MSRFLKQTAVLERHMTTSQGQPKLDAYGYPMYQVGIRVKCRKESFTARGENGQGQYSEFKHRYYLDESVPVAEGDKLDGYEVQQVEEYVDGFGHLVGYEVTV